MLFHCSMGGAHRLTNNVQEAQTRKADEKSKVSTNGRYQVCQVIRLQLLQPKQRNFQVKSCQVSLQFKLPWHHEYDHLGVFRKVSFWTLSDIVSPWHHVQGFQSKFGVVARRARDAGQGFLQQLIHYEREIS